eukprot:TRINITY_DN8587_c0_g1_i2.p1 TRINITY_DN8587_c0_g1~~TRINITY_DN8587_c0_g1_i2.p1  ORF type:complete len:129 (+),score=18.47 TRINITY_DN8587_c0_g1_i2:578-964(+)
MEKNCGEFGRAKSVAKGECRLDRSSSLPRFEVECEKSCVSEVESIKGAAVINLNIGGDGLDFSRKETSGKESRNDDLMHNSSNETAKRREVNDMQYAGSLENNLVLISGYVKCHNGRIANCKENAGSV